MMFLLNLMCDYNILQVSLRITGRRVPARDRERKRFNEQTGIVGLFFMRNKLNRFRKLKYLSFCENARPFFIFSNMHKNDMAFLCEITKGVFAKKTCILPKIQLIYKKPT